MAPEHNEASPLRSPHFRLRDGGIATLFLIGALLVMFGITRTDVIAYAQQIDLFYIAAGMIAVSIPGPVIRLWDLPGQLFLWNAAGWCLGLSVFGMASIGATPVFPLVLLGLALTFWPRPDDIPIPWLGGSIAFVGGFVLCWVLWGNVYVDIPFTSA
jgi:hypothetical protein